MSAVPARSSGGLRHRRSPARVCTRSSRTIIRSSWKSLGADCCSLREENSGLAKTVESLRSKMLDLNQELQQKIGDEARLRNVIEKELREAHEPQVRAAFDRGYAACESAYEKAAAFLKTFQQPRVVPLAAQASVSPTPFGSGRSDAESSGA